MTSPWCRKGFTLVEILLTLSLVAILATVGISLFSKSVDEVRYDATLETMKNIRQALVGDPEAKQGTSRASFGYLGDMGALPQGASGLSSLLTKPATAANWNTSNAANIAFGWNGPYLVLSAGNLNAFKDAWDRDIAYSSGSTATLTSLGADGTSGGSGIDQDIVMSIPPELQFATVSGFVSNGGAPYNGSVQVEINAPNGSGQLATTLQTVAANTQGLFQFNQVPLGHRSITVYSPTKASPTQTIGPVSVTVDRANFLVPADLIDLNPAAGIGAGTNCVNSGMIQLIPVVGFGVNSSIFRVSVSTNLTIFKFKVHTTSNPGVQDLYFDGTRYACSEAAGTFTPCPAPDSITAVLNPPIPAAAGSNKEVWLFFTNGISRDQKVTLELTHSLGCDVLTVVPIY